MKARLVPLYFDPGRDEDFDRQLAALRELLAEQAEFLPPVAVGQPPPEADAVVFPQLLGEAYRHLADFKAIDVPILIITSESGTLAMWDWEIAAYLRSEGVETIAPYNLAQTRNVCAALGVKRELRDAKFLVFQDNPGEGAQASIFKRFYWWEDECVRRIKDKFGLTIARKSYKTLAEEAKAIPDAEAERVWREWRLPTEGVDGRPLNSAVKLYIALRRELDADPAVRGVGTNCLNESHFSDTTPCLAWSMLFAERNMIWGCEADTMAMLTEYILYHSLGARLMMTNLYPFLLGDAALKHERIAAFPDVPAEPENHVLVAHCGYLGVVPTEFATAWTLRPKVLAMVNDNATAIDARMSTGPVTLAKLHPRMDRMTVAAGELTDYAQFPGSDCLNGGVIRVRNGHRLVSSLASHHYILVAGHHIADIENIAKVFDLEIQQI